MGVNQGGCIEFLASDWQIKKLAYLIVDLNVFLLGQLKGFVFPLNAEIKTIGVQSFLRGKTPFRPSPSAGSRIFPLRLYFFKAYLKNSFGFVP